MWIAVALGGGVLIVSGLALLVRAWAILAHEALRESSVGQAEQLRREKPDV